MLRRSWQHATPNDADIAMSVCDASAVVALLLDDGPDGRWAAESLRSGRLRAPSLMRFEAANIIRRHTVLGRLDIGLAAQAHQDLLDLPFDQWPYGLLAPRVWELRDNLTSYDASYVALAELTGDPLFTLDRRIARAPGLRCAVHTPS